MFSCLHCGLNSLALNFSLMMEHKGNCIMLKRIKYEAESIVHSPAIVLTLFWLTLPQKAVLWLPGVATQKDLKSRWLDIQWNSSVVFAPIYTKYAVMLQDTLHDVEVAKLFWSPWQQLVHRIGFLCIEPEKSTTHWAIVLQK